MVKILRLVARIGFYVCNAYRKLVLRMMYPGLKIDRQSIVGKNCSIICVDGGKMIIKNSSIGAGTHLFADKEGIINIESSSVGRYSVIVAKQSIIIESGVAIAEMVVIRDQDHAVDVNGLEPGFCQYNIAPIHIGKNVWIASKATILKGVTVGNDSLIAASAVVTKPVPENEVWGGIPARFIKKVRI